MDSVTKQQIQDDLKNIFTADYLRPYKEHFVSLAQLINDTLVGKQWTVEDAETIHNTFSEKCEDATKNTCSIVREAARIRGVFNNFEQCEACPFNIFCIGTSEDTSKIWHTNMVAIWDKLKEVLEKDIVISDDRMFVDNCISTMTSALELQTLHNIVEVWSE